MERKVKGHVKPNRSVSSNRWMHEHVTDPFVQRAKKLGYRSRAAFKIIEIDEKFRIFKRGLTVVDLGATPGGWSQIAGPKVGVGAAKGAGRVIAVDMIEMHGLPGVEFLQVDFSTDEGLAALVAALGIEGKADMFCRIWPPTCQASASRIRPRPWACVSWGWILRGVSCVPMVHLS